MKRQRGPVRSRCAVYPGEDAPRGGGGIAAGCPRTRYHPLGRDGAGACSRLLPTRILNRRANGVEDGRQRCWDRLLTHPRVAVPDARGGARRSQAEPGGARGEEILMKLRPPWGAAGDAGGGVRAAAEADADRGDDRRERGERGVGRGAPDLDRAVEAVPVDAAHAGAEEMPWVTKTGEARPVDRPAEGLAERQPIPADRRVTDSVIGASGRGALRADEFRPTSRRMGRPSPATRARPPSGRFAARPVG